MGLSTDYLPHLDGLRTIALAGVLLFHFEVPYFQGGFAGVDIFFSISGFLITRNILREIAKDSFSLTSFYKRRFFRLYPASVCTAAFTLVMAFLTFTPGRFVAVAQSALASMLFFSNVLFHAQAGYFDEAASIKPLLHTWSLSLEEQYYLFWAPLIVLVSKYHRRFIALSITLLLMLISSFTLGVFLNSTHPSFVFFELPTRIWQFAAGALIYIFDECFYKERGLQSPASAIRSEGYSKSPAGNHAAKDRSLCNEGDLEMEGSEFIQNPYKAYFILVSQEVVALFAFSGLIASYVLLPREAPIYLMAPTTLFTCIVMALPQTLLSRYFLSLSPLTAFGRLSYSGYLVHWPLYVFALHFSVAFSLGNPNPIMLTVITTTLAILLKKGLEDPVRRGHRRIFFAVLTVSTATFAASVLHTQGYQSRTDPVDTTIGITYQGPRYSWLCKRSYMVKGNVTNLHAVKEACIVGDAKGKQGRYIFVGDSFTMHISSGFAEIGESRGEWYPFYYRWGCKFLPRSYKHLVPERCLQSHKWQWEQVEGMPRGLVAVSNWWGVHGSPPMDQVLPALKRELRAAGHKLILIGEPPGLSPKAVQFFKCADLAVMPLARIWSKIRGNPYTAAAKCADLSKGLEPYPGRREEQLEYWKIFNTTMRGERFVDTFSKMCIKDDREQGNWVCRVPGKLSDVVYDIGYGRGGVHFTMNGSRGISDIYGNALFGTP